MTGALARGAGVLASVVTLPFVARDVGKHEFGIYLTIASIAILASALSLGLGQGLISPLAAQVEKGLKADAQAQISSAVAASGVVALTFTLVVVPLVFVADVSTFIGVRPEDAGSVNVSVAIALGATLLALPSAIANDIRLALQESYVTNLWLAGSALVQTIIVSGLALLGAPLPFLVGGLTGVPLLAQVAHARTLYRGERIWLRPRWRDAQIPLAVRLLRQGTVFLVLSISSLIAFQTDSLVISKLISPESVAQYAVPFRVFSFVPVLTGVFVLPLWPVFAQAFARGDVATLREVLRKALVLVTVMAVPLCLALTFAAVPVSEALSDGQVSPSWLLVLLLDVYALVQCWSMPYAMYLNGVRAVRFQLVAAIAMTVANLATSIVLTRAMGITGPLVASAASQTLVILIPTVFYARRRLSGSQHGAIPTTEDYLP